MRLGLVDWEVDLIVDELLCNMIFYNKDRDKMCVRICGHD